MSVMTTKGDCSMAEISWSYASVTDRGLIRSDNQDNLFVGPDKRLFVVADGMGGTRGGAIASRVAVETLESWWKDKNPNSDEQEKVHTWLRDAVCEANQNIIKAAENEEISSRMGTTIVVAKQCEGGVVHLAHVGDSRAILVRPEEIVALTRDHSVVMEMLVNGKLTEEQFLTSPFRHLLTRCLGHDREVEVDTSTTEMKPGDWLILATDGLTSVMKNDEVAGVVRGAESPDDACKKLLACVEEKGAPDNVTIIVINYVLSDEKAEGKPQEKALT